MACGTPEELDFIDSAGSTKKTALSSEQEKLIKGAMDQDATSRGDNKSKSFTKEVNMTDRTRNKQTRDKHEDSHVKQHEDAEIPSRESSMLGSSMSLQHTRVEMV